MLAFRHETMPLGHLLKKLESSIRSVAETPFEETRHPLALRRRVLETVEDLAARQGGTPDAPGRVVVYLVAEDEAHRQTLQQAFVGDAQLERAVRARLREAGVDSASRLRIDVELVPRAEAKDYADGGYVVDWVTEEPGGGEKNGTNERAPARLVVEEGVAEREVFDLEGRPYVHVGRMKEVTNARGQITRRNEVAFEDDATDVNQTVSRSHAVIVYDEASDAYRVRDQGSQWGTSIYRDGHDGLIPVKRRGVALSHGDILYFGKARVRFERAAPS